jgi:peptide deformylase
MTSINVKALGLDGRPVRIKAQDYLARVIQHEVDHLDGILFVDRIEDRSTLREASDAEETELELAE